MSPATTEAGSAKITKTYGGCLFVAFLIVLAYLLLAPVFSEARKSALESRRYDDGIRLARAVRKYVEGHKGLLPGVRWTSALEGIDPGIIANLWREVDGTRLGYGAVPGVLGRKLADLPSDTILFIEVRSGRTNSIIHDLSEVGGRLRTGSAIAVRAENVQAEKTPSMVPLIRLGMDLTRQKAPNLK